jgi:hypothetical protein
VVSFKVMDVRVPPNLTVGYVMGSGDDVPTALRHARELLTLAPADAQLRAMIADLERRQAR